MGDRVLVTLMAALWVLLIGTVFTVSAAEDSAQEPPAALTTADPGIPVDELVLWLKPLTKDELLVEADAWLALLRAKAVEIARAEIAVKRQNREIEKTQEIQAAAQEAKEHLEEVKVRAEEAKASGDAEKVKETEQAASEALAKMQEVSATVEEAAAADNTAEVEDRIDPETRQDLDETADAAQEAQDALDRVQDAVEDVDVDSSESVRTAASEARDATAEAERATTEVQEKAREALEQAQKDVEEGQTIDATTAAMEQVEEAKVEEKVELLEEVNELREERTLIIDHLKAVLDELESKTDKEDSDTLAKINDYRLYISSVSGIRVDVKDTTSAWAAIKGWLVSDEGGIRLATNLALFLGILFLAWMLSKMLSRAVHRALGMMGTVSQLLEDFLVGAVRWIVMAVGIIMALAALEVSIGPLLAVVGAAGFVIAFALQDSLSNFASGLMILFFRPFDVGDVIDAGGVSGKVISMNLVSTTVKTFDNKDMVVPNNKIWNDVITNATAVDTRRVDMEFGIGYDDDIDQAQTILEEIVATHPKALKDPEPTIRMHTLADSSVNFICRPWAKTGDVWEVYWDVTKAVKQRFDAEGIGIPYPQRDVHLYLEDGAFKAKLAGLPLDP
ncbi:MAG: mechanosensitive ion channel [Pseudomonadota bacterium]|nr:mechanosensitive ion channel [Pseudomonadota bacterium]